MSPDDLATIVVDTAAAVKRANLDDHWGVEAFKVALSAQLTAALGGVRLHPTSNTPYGAEGASNGHSLPPLPGTGQFTGQGRSLGELRDRLRLQDTDLSDVFHPRDGRIEVHVPRSWLPKSKNGAVKDLALLVCAADQIGGNEWTSVEAIRKVTEEYGAYDSSNFTGSLRALDTLATSRGKLSAREFRLTRGGWEHTAAIVRKIVEADH